MEFEIGRIITYNDGRDNAIVTYANDKEKCLYALCHDGETHCFDYNQVVKTDVLVKSMDTIMYNLKYCRY